MGALPKYGSSLRLISAMLSEISEGRLECIIVLASHWVGIVQWIFCLILPKEGSMINKYVHDKIFKLSWHLYNMLK